jgi:hypothetical protein
LTCVGAAKARGRTREALQKVALADAGLVEDLKGLP